MNRITLFVVLGAIVGVAAAVFLVSRFTGGVRDLNPVTVRASQVIDQEVAFPALTSDGKKLVYFGKGDGGQTGIVRIDLSTRSRELFRPMPQVAGMTWSPDRSQVVLTIIYNEDEFKQSAPRFLSNSLSPYATSTWLYDLEQDRLEQLPESTSSVAWSADGEKIVYHFLDLTGINPVSELSVRTPFSADREKLVDIPPAASYTLAFLDQSTVMAVPNLSSPSGTSTIYFVDTTAKTLTAKEEDGVSSATASQDGQRILFASSGDQPDWRLFDRTSDAIRDLKLEANGQYTAWIDPDTLVIIEPRAEEQDRIWVVKVGAFTRQELILDGALHVESQPQIVAGRVYFESGGKLFTFALPQ